MALFLWSVIFLFIFGCAVNYSLAGVPIEGLLAYWPFDDSSVVGKPSFGGALLQSYGNPTYNADGRYGGAVLFDGASYLYEIDGSSFLPCGSCAYTLAAWVKFLNVPTIDTNGFISYGTMNYNQANFLVDEPTGRYFFNGWWYNDIEYRTDFYMDNVWSHVAATWDGMVRTLYVNGNVVASGMSFGTPSVDRVNFNIGAIFSDGSGSPTCPMNGLIDEVAIYSRALSPYEMQSLMLSTYRPPPFLIDGLLAYWSFDNSSVVGKPSFGGALLQSYGNPTYNADGRYGGAVLFDGASSLYEIDGSSFLPCGSCAYTLAAWVKFVEIPSDGLYSIITYGSSNFHGGHLLRADIGSSYLLDAWYFDDLSYSTNFYVNDEWSHVAATWDGEFRTIYVNGDVVASELHPGAPSFDLINFNIGAFQFEGTPIWPMNGLIDEVYIYSRGLTQLEIQALMNSREYKFPDAGSDRISAYTKIPSNGLLAYWSFDNPTSLGMPSYGGASLEAYGSPTSFDGIYGGAISFNGESFLYKTNPWEFLPCGSCHYTLAAWVKFTRDRKNFVYCFLSYGTGATRRGHTFCDINLYGVYLQDGWWGDDLSYTTNFYTNDTWFHVAATWDGEFRLLYVNGDVVASEYHLETPSFDLVNFNIGALFLDENITFNWPMDGLMDEVVIYNRGLSQSEIQSIMIPYPTSQPSTEPSSQPSRQPSLPTSTPSAMPTNEPSSQLSQNPTLQPISKPSHQPTYQPSGNPSNSPTSQPSDTPTTQPVHRPSALPTNQPSGKPSNNPSSRPSRIPTAQPFSMPSSDPSSQPSDTPTAQPSTHPSYQPSSSPSAAPSSFPTSFPTNLPSLQSSSIPSSQPNPTPTIYPSSVPSCRPTSIPTSIPTSSPSALPSCQPSSKPSSKPSCQPSGVPTHHPSSIPSSKPSLQPRSTPTVKPYNRPSSQPSAQPTSNPSCQVGKRQDSISGCTPCPPGSYSDNGALTECILCDPGFYQPDYGQSECLPCRYGKTSFSPGQAECKNFTLYFGSIAFVYSVVLGTFAIFLWGHLSITGDMDFDDPKKRMTSGERRTAVLLNTIMPVFDACTNVAYVLKETFYNEVVFAFAVILFMHTVFYFIYQLIYLRAIPVGFIQFVRAFIWIGYTTSKELIEKEKRAEEERIDAQLQEDMTNSSTLQKQLEDGLKETEEESRVDDRSSVFTPASTTPEIYSKDNINNSRPRDRPDFMRRSTTVMFEEAGDSFPMATIYGNHILPFPFYEHSSMAILFYEIFGWILAITLQFICFVAAVVLYIPFLVFWFAVGMLIQHMKMFIIGRAWNIWFRVWTFDSTFDVDDNLVDTADFNATVVFHFFVESVPHMSLQAFNNTLLGQWNPLSVVSMVCSGFAVLNGMYTFVYFRYFKTGSRVSLKNIPIRKLLRLKIPALKIDYVIIDAKLNAQQKDLKQLKRAGYARFKARLQLCGIKLSDLPEEEKPQENLIADINSEDMNKKQLQGLTIDTTDENECNESGRYISSSSRLSYSSGLAEPSIRLYGLSESINHVEEEKPKPNTLNHEMFSSFIHQFHPQIYLQLMADFLAADANQIDRNTSIVPSITIPNNDMLREESVSVSMTPPQQIVRDLLLSSSDEDKSEDGIEEVNVAQMRRVSSIDRSSLSRSLSARTFSRAASVSSKEIKPFLAPKQISRQLSITNGDKSVFSSPLPYSSSDAFPPVEDSQSITELQSIPIKDI